MDRRGDRLDPRGWSSGGLRCVLDGLLSSSLRDPRRLGRFVRDHDGVGRVVDEPGDGEAELCAKVAQIGLPLREADDEALEERGVHVAAARELLRRGVVECGEGAVLREKLEDILLDAMQPIKEIARSGAEEAVEER